MQLINITEDIVACEVCGENLAELGNFVYDGVTNNTSRTKNEDCHCKKCGHPFQLHYEFFDEKGHINSYVFNGDPNDPSYNWQDILTNEQKEEISRHLKECKICTEKLTEVMISDAWLASLIHSCSKK